MTCRQLVRLVTEYLEGALAPADRRRFEQHLAGCEGCSAYLEQLRTTLRLLGRLDEESLAPEMRRRLFSAFRAWRPA